ncbi:hypothetical protein V8C86DRAFT_2878417 [Haematococcus lacustris]
MVWEDIGLDTKRVCMAPFGGPIATMRDEQAMVMVTSSQSVQPVVRIFTAAGTALGSFLWESQSRLVDWCWSHGLQLVVMEDSGLLSLRCDTAGHTSLSPTRPTLDCHLVQAAVGVLTDLLCVFKRTTIHCTLDAEASRQLTGKEAAGRLGRRYEAMHD